MMSSWEIHNELWYSHLVLGNCRAHSPGNTSNSYERRENMAKSQIHLTENINPHFCHVHTGEGGWYSLQLFLYQHVSFGPIHTFCNQIKLPTAVTKPQKTMENILNQIDISSGSVKCYVSCQVSWILTKTWIYMKNKSNLMTFICKIHIVLQTHYIRIMEITIISYTHWNKNGFEMKICVL